MPESPTLSRHTLLTRRFIVALIVTVVVFIVALGLLATWYATTSAEGKTGLLVAVFVTLALGVVAAVFSAYYSVRISRLNRR